MTTASVPNHGWNTASDASSARSASRSGAAGSILPDAAPLAAPIETVPLAVPARADANDACASSASLANVPATVSALTPTPSRRVDVPDGTSATMSPRSRCTEKRPFSRGAAAIDQSPPSTSVDSTRQRPAREARGRRQRNAGERAARRDAPAVPDELADVGASIRRLDVRIGDARVIAMQRERGRSAQPHRNRAAILERDERAAPARLAGAVDVAQRPVERKRRVDVAAANRERCMVPREASRRAGVHVVERARAQCATAWP